jgi:hypothetical protein
LGPFVVAVKSITLVGGDGGVPPAGLDLDEQCTCPGPPSCVFNGAPACDRASGVDNSTLALFAGLAESGFSLADDNVREGLTKGLYGIVFKVTGYSGLPDDARVTVEMMNAISVNDGGLPAFDGHDDWVLDSTSFDDAGLSTASTFGGYVAQGTLVAPFVRLTPKLRLVITPTINVLIDVDIDDAVVMGTIGLSDAGATLTNAQITGRIRVSSWLKQIQRGGRCASTGAFAGAQQQICRFRDLAATAASDNKGAACDSISVAIAFEAAPATTEPVPRTATESPSACDSTLDASVGCP